MIALTMLLDREVYDVIEGEYIFDYYLIVLLARIVQGRPYFVPCIYP